MPHDLQKLTVSWAGANYHREKVPTDRYYLGYIIRGATKQLPKNTQHNLVTKEIIG